MRDFRQIQVWSKAHALTLRIYEMSSLSPRKSFTVSQVRLRRASASIPANIAEGYGRGGDVELARFLLIGMGSAYEVEYHLLLAKDLGLLASPGYESPQNEMVEVKRMLAALLLKVKQGRR